MKVVRGMDEGKKALNRGQLEDEQHNNPALLQSIEHVFGESLNPAQAVTRILSDIRESGDEAIARYTKLIDGVDLQGFEVDRESVLVAAGNLSEEIQAALIRSASRVREFNISSMPKSWVDFERGFGEILNPIERVGIYVPGGSAAYPSTVLMTTIPARVAGVKEIVLCTPPNTDGSLNPAVMSAALMGNVDRVFLVGGAQAIGAMAYGTNTIPKVDMICGPGNIFVTTAKKMVSGDVNIDGLEGPTETLVIADHTANPAFCAADLLAQAEHDELATPILVTTHEELVPLIQEQLVSQSRSLRRKDVALASVERTGVIVFVDIINEAVELGNYYAPEHICLMVEQPWSIVAGIHNAGGIFLGDYSPEVMGDYVAGPSHVMPTGGSARFNSYLGVNQFLRRTPVVGLDRQMAMRLISTASTIAMAEGLDAHARAAEIRMEF